MRVGYVRFWMVALVMTLTAGAGEMHAAAGRTVYELNGPRIAARFGVEQDALRVAWVEDVATHERLAPGEAFSVKLRDGRVVKASEMKVQGRVTAAAVAPVKGASRAAEQAPGRRVCAELAMEDGSLKAHWCAVLRAGANYVRQEVTLEAGAKPVDVAEVRMFDFAAKGAEVVGKVSGSPLVAGNFFFGFEFPLAESAVAEGRATSLLQRTLPLEPGKQVTYSSVVGVARPGQMRRDFLAYVEQERAHPYRTFLHYNTWYDIGYFSRFDERAALDRVNAFGTELVKKRGVKLDSLLFDDGWDDPTTLWQFHAGFPDGFTKVRGAAAGYGHGIGVWMSPWGGYGKPKQQRIVAGEKAGYEMVEGGFALSAPKYYGLFERTCLEMMHKYGVNQFKFDGTGNASRVFPGSVFDSDFSAAIHLIERLRQEDPQIYINLTTGTLPSPFWLRYADSIWRDGEDHDFAGVGTWRQKWITYRDNEVYRNIVVGGPLYPLNSLMLHGILYAQKAKHLGDDPGDDFQSEVRDYFGTGTQLQEMYITPGLLTEKNWDALAEGAKWSRANAAVLKDTHWIGGDPGKLEVYGYASWNREKGIVMLRNPSDKPQSYELDVEKAFELPVEAVRDYLLKSPWAADAKRMSVRVNAGKVWRVELQPFEVLTFDAMPVKGVGGVRR